MVQELLSYNLLLDYYWRGAARERAPPRAESRDAPQRPLTVSPHRVAIYDATA